MLNNHLAWQSALKAIARDPMSWRGVSFHYLCFAPGEMAQAIAENNPDIFVIKNDSDACIILGSKAACIPAREPVSSLWIKDISASWAQIAELFGIDSATQPTKKPDKTITILIVEDEEMTNKILANNLKQFGTVITTANSREAIANNIVLNPDIIFLDIHYHDDVHDGFDVLASILSNNAKAFVVMFSSDKNPEIILKCLASGAQGFIAKPFKPSDFSYYLDTLQRI